MFPVIIFSLSLAVTFLAWRHEISNTQRDLQSALDFQLQQTTGRIEQRIAAYEEMLRGLQGLLAVTGNSRASDFTDYVDSLQLGADFSGLKAIALSRVVPPEQIEDFVAQMRRQRDAAYHIWPEGVRELYAPIVQVEPAMGRNLLALGFDPLGEPSRRLILEQARDSGLVTLSGKIKLASDNGPSPPPGFFLTLPIFKNGAPHDNPAVRRANTVGWIIAAFRMSDVMASLYGEGTAGIVTEIFDGTRPTNDMRLYPASDDQTSLPEFAASEFVVIAGHTWTVTVHSTPGFKALLDRDKSNIIALAGVVLGLLASLVGWQMATGRERAQRIARIMTRELKESEECWKFALEGAGDGVWDWNIASDELRYSDRLKAIFGNEEVGNLNCFERWTSRIHPDDLATEQARLQACLNGKASSYFSEHRIRWTDGAWRWVSERAMVVSHDPEGRPLRMIGTISDISERRTAEERVRHMAQHDPLTNLPNRLLFSDRLNQALARAKREKEHIALLFVDLDKFKPINDLHGHDVGDLVLKEVARRMRQCVRDSDTVARIGGDEFIILLSSVGSSNDAFLVAEKVRSAIARGYALAGLQLNISSSIGISIFPDDGDDVRTLSKNADNAMYRAKQAGHNNVQFYGENVLSKTASSGE
jgi:diguanylate cyclase (GGDEF)-like protein/PAS domain S-box-containing protein